MNNFLHHFRWSCTTNRIVFPVPTPGPLNVTVSSKENRRSSLNTTVSSPNEFKAWFFEKEADEGQEVRERQNLKYADPELEAVRTVLKKLDGFSAMRSRKPSESAYRTLYLVKHGANIPFDSLSGGRAGVFLTSCGFGSPSDAGVAGHERRQYFRYRLH